MAPIAKTGVGVELVNDYLPPADVSERLVIQDTSLSLQVKDVADVISRIQSIAQELGGFLVSSNLSQPEQSATGTISVRVPEDKRTEALSVFKGLAVKTVSESVNGVDVTDAYVDLQSRLDVLMETKQKFEEILDKAVAVDDLLNVQRQLISIQSQIDDLKGQQKYYEQSSKLTKINVYLATDELALPYAPDGQWRPLVVFKQAVRSLVGVLRSFGNLIIWAIVFLPLITPAAFVYFAIRRRRSKISKT